MVAYAGPSHALPLTTDPPHRTHRAPEAPHPGDNDAVELSAAHRATGSGNPNARGGV